MLQPNTHHLTPMVLALNAALSTFRSTYYGPSVPVPLGLGSAPVEKTVYHHYQVVVRMVLRFVRSSVWFERGTLAVTADHVTCIFSLSPLVPHSIARTADMTRFPRKA